MLKKLKTLFKITIEHTLSYLMFKLFIDKRLLPLINFLINWILDKGGWGILYSSSFLFLPFVTTCCKFIHFGLALEHLCSLYIIYIYVFTYQKCHCLGKNCNNLESKEAELASSLLLKCFKVLINYGNCKKNSCARANCPHKISQHCQCTDAHTPEGCCSGYVAIEFFLQVSLPVPRHHHLLLLKNHQEFIWWPP